MCTKRTYKKPDIEDVAILMPAKYSIDMLHLCVDKSVHTGSKNVNYAKKEHKIPRLFAPHMLGLFETLKRGDMTTLQQKRRRLAMGLKMVLGVEKQ